MLDIDTRTIDRKRFRSGGVSLSLKAHVTCAGCTECQDYYANATADKLQCFRGKADAAFKAAGWVTDLRDGEFKTWCPTCQGNRR